MGVAAEKGHVEIVNALLAQNADVNAATTCGATALLFASQNGHLSVVQRLLAAPSIEVNKAPATDGTTPLHAAAMYGHVAVVQTLLAALM